MHDAWGGICHPPLAAPPVTAGTLRPLAEPRGLGQRSAQCESGGGQLMFTEPSG